MPKRNPGKGVKTMPHDAPRRQNWFARGGRSYALYRPDYPPELPAFLACTSPGRGVAVDVGCGNGQLTVQLAEHFSKVIGTDPSADQIAHPTSHDRVEYFRAPAERQPVPDQTADLITAAQAAHWFDMPAFCAEVRRIARSEAVVALITCLPRALQSIATAAGEGVRCSGATLAVAKWSHARLRARTCLGARLRCSSQSSASA